MCGRGIGAVGALFAAVDGGSRLWDAKGLWRRPAVARLCTAGAGRFELRSACSRAWRVCSSARCCSSRSGSSSISLGCCSGWLGSSREPALVAEYANLLTAAFAPAALPTWLPRLDRSGRHQRDHRPGGRHCAIGARVASPATVARDAGAWSLLSAPVDGVARHRIISPPGCGTLLKGGASLKAPHAEDLSRRYSELLNENLAQPGFTELLLVVHDLDARRDLIFGLVREPFRRALFPPPGAAGAAPGRRVRSRRPRAGSSGRCAARRPERGRRDRACAGAVCARLATGAAKPIGSSIAPPAWHVCSKKRRPRGPSRSSWYRPRRSLLDRTNLDGRASIRWLASSEHAASFESAALRDAIEHVQHRFRAVYRIRPRAQSSRRIRPAWSVRRTVRSSALARRN